MSDAVEPLDLGPIRERVEDARAERAALSWGDLSPAPAPVDVDLDALLAEVERLRVALTTARRDALTEAAEALNEDEDVAMNVILGGPGYVAYWLRARAAQEEGR